VALGEAALARVTVADARIVPLVRVSSMRIIVSVLSVVFRIISMDREWRVVVAIFYVLSRDNFESRYYRNTIYRTLNTT